MKKNIFLFFFFLFFLHASFSQTKKEMTILYLIPFNLDSISTINLNIINLEQDIYNKSSFEIFGFWEGAQIALDEYANSDFKINVIVRDIITDSIKLKNILEDSHLMKNVNLIIGPFYSSMFAIAAQYAKKNEIPIVNLFSSRQDFISNNPFVYKLLPPLEICPEIINKLILAKQNNNIILWGETKNFSAEQKAYMDYYSNHQIPFQVTASSSLPSLIKTKNNVVIAFFEDIPTIVNQIRLLSGQAKLENNFSLIVPERWMNINSLDEDFFSLPNLYFFTNVFVDNTNENTTLFQYKYIEKFQTPPDILCYSYQGYDITKYFIELYFAENNLEKLKFKPVFSQFKFVKKIDGGYVNQKVRLIKVVDFDLHEVSIPN